MNCWRCEKPLVGMQQHFCSITCKNIYNVNEWRRRTKKRCIEYLGGKCLKCGYNRCEAVLGFHHRDPRKKDFTISSGATRSWKLIKRELDKCDLLCANCHGETHYSEQLAC